MAGHPQAPERFERNRFTAVRSTGTAGTRRGGLLDTGFLPPDSDTEMEPVSTAGAGQRPPPELDRLSNVVSAFNDRFGDIACHDRDRVGERRAKKGTMIDERFRERFWEQEDARPHDDRDAYQRDRARVIHSAAFRRLQAKTQVMGVGEGDFHRTRLTHSIEAAQIGEGLVGTLRHKYAEDPEACKWLPSRDLLAGACLAHDLGHPPFGHAGEEALHRRVASKGGFEGNAHTLRIVTRLEKYKYGQGMNPTRRFILGLLKYPMPYSAFEVARYRNRPPKCYFDSEKPIVEWALGSEFLPHEVYKLTNETSDGRPKHRTLDSSLMEFADDIAYGVHDLEDLIARRMATREDVLDRLGIMFGSKDRRIGVAHTEISLSDFDGDIWNKHAERKGLIGKLVHLFITSARIEHRDDFANTRCSEWRVSCDEPIRTFLDGLKRLAYELVIERAGIQQLERRGQRVIDRLFCEFIQAPEKLIPRTTWEYYDEYSAGDSKERRVCDYIAGMTDPFANRIYHRLFTPGEGSSRDEL